MLKNRPGNINIVLRLTMCTKTRLISYGEEVLNLVIEARDLASS